MLDAESWPVCAFLSTRGPLFCDPVRSEGPRDYVGISGLPGTGMDLVKTGASVAGGAGQRLPNASEPIGRMSQWCTKKRIASL